MSLRLPLLVCILASLSGAARAAEAPHPCGGAECRWGADKDGVPSFWVSRNAAGQFEPGYESLLRAQRFYNKWAKGNRNGDRFRDVSWRDHGRGGWSGDALQAPSWIPEDGRLSPRTLMIGVYHDGAELLRLWDVWRDDCRRNEYADTPACQARAGAAGPEPGDALLKKRAEVLRRGFAASRSYQAKVNELDAFLTQGTEKAEKQESYDLDRLPKDELARLEELAKSVEQSLGEAETLERRFQAQRDPFE